MSDKPDNLKQAKSAALTAFEDRLHGSLDDEAVLTEIHSSIRALVANDDGSESEIREIVQNRFDAGDLRPESVELVHKLLDSMADEEPATAANAELSPADDEPATAAYAELSLVDEEPATAANDWSLRLETWSSSLPTASPRRWMTTASSSGAHA